MGIPKFFRWISERYPLTSQLIQENKIPEFDNLYLDFNGIIHQCSHPNDNDAHFRMTEEQIFTAIFAYVDHVFGKIKPKKLFFMAVDGCAPRAKMNQQRSRRFRTAKEAKELTDRAILKGETLPSEKAFDTNAITPGTPFMFRLSAQMRYFVNKKISEDADWRGVKVVLSGHDVPGEGEHKIMEYIRLSRAQKDYNPNVRHCLYGLDADLIMLGLLSHDPHFCLLREEVKFGPARKKSNTSLDAINFYLLHLSLLREYLDLEFNSLNTPLSSLPSSSSIHPAPQTTTTAPPTSLSTTLPFTYSIERIIDDFVLLAVFIGNDFLPNIPDLHIHQNGLEKLFDVYKGALPKMGGYLNDGGKINLERLQMILDEMGVWEREEVFRREYFDSSWLKGKTDGKGKGRGKGEAPLPIDARGGLRSMTESQRVIFDKVKDFVRSSSSSPALKMKNDFAARDRKFVTMLCEDLRLDVAWDEFDEDGGNLCVVRTPVRAGVGRRSGVDDGDLLGGTLEGAGVIPPSSSNDASSSADDDGTPPSDESTPLAATPLAPELDSSDEEEEEESRAAIDRVLSKFERMAVVDDSEEAFEKRQARGVEEKMAEWKGEYYLEKLDIDYEKPEELGAIVYRYVEGLQWVMHYYYSGVASWGWFYDYHYAPRISDLKNVAQLEFNFVLGEPFHPYQQLMGVLPAASKELVPSAFRDLMTDPNSPIIDFYPLDFDQDLNGKKADWEAIVKIPFIDEERLVKAMAAREHRLAPSEQIPKLGSSVKFAFNHGEPTVYPSSLPGFFPPLYRCQCIEEAFHLPTLNGLHLIPGLCDGVVLGEEALAGFPSLKTLPYMAVVGVHGVNVHGYESKNQSIVVHITNPHSSKTPEQIAHATIGKRIFTGWPFPHEGLVVAVSDSHFKYEMMNMIPGKPAKVASTPHSPAGLGHWKSKAERIEQVYSKRFGVVPGEVEVLVHVRPLKGLKRLDDGALKKEYEGAAKEVEFAVQMTLDKVISEDPRFLERPAPKLDEEFPDRSNVFFLGEHAYGTAAQVSSTANNSLSVVLALMAGEKNDNQQLSELVRTRKSASYFPSYRVGEMLGLSGHAISKVTSSFMVTSGGQKVNLGLSIKFESKGLKVVGYSRKVNGRIWEFSQRAVELMDEYKAKYPVVFTWLHRSGSAMPKASDMFPGENADAQVKEIRSWLGTKGVKDFEPVDLTVDVLDKDIVKDIEALTDSFRDRSSAGIKKAIVKNIPREAVLRPADVIYRLRDQKFSLGDRVTMVRDTGGIPLSAKGVVVGLGTRSLDVVWDVAFVSGSSLGGRCTMYRGATVEFDACLNLTQPQYVRDPRTGGAQRMAVQPVGVSQNQNQNVGAQGQQQGNEDAAGFQPGPNVRIMTNVARGRGGQFSAAAGRGIPQVNAGPANGHSGQSGPSRPPRGGMNGGGRGARGGLGHLPQGGVNQQQQNPSGPVPGRGGFRGRGGRGGPPPQALAQQDQQQQQQQQQAPRGRGRGGFRGGRGGQANTPPIQS